MSLQNLGVVCLICTSILLSACFEGEARKIPDAGASSGPQDEQVLRGNMKNYPSNCAEALAHSNRSGIHEILVPSYRHKPFKVVCDAQTRGGKWTVILKRFDGSVNFFRNWNAYKKGFGDLDGEFFLGLDKIHALTGERSQELLIEVEDRNEQSRYELYEKFGIGDEDDLYALHVLGKATGSAGDSLIYHHAQNFSTYDRDNSKNCANKRNGAWWYSSGSDCQTSNLFGVYGDNGFEMGINWRLFQGLNYSMRKAVMMIRPRN